MSALWGIDLGGTKIEGVVAEAVSDGLEPLVRPRMATEADRGYDWIIDQVGRMVEDMESRSDLPRPRVIGIGTPGSVRPDGTMKNCNTTCLNGRPLPSDLAKALGAQVVVRNDADCFALAEALLGAGRGHRTVFGVIMGTGVGGGIVCDGRLLSGPNGLTGEWGHMTLDPGGPTCYCGRRGCVETYLSGPAVEKFHHESTGKRSPLAEIAASSDAASLRTIAEMCAWFGQAIAQVVNVLDPDVIVLGGGAGQVPQLRDEGVVQARRHVFGPDFSTPIVLPQLGDSAGVFGAALLARTSGAP